MNHSQLRIELLRLIRELDHNFPSSKKGWKMPADEFETNQTNLKDAIAALKEKDVRDTAEAERMAAEARERQLQKKSQEKLADDFLYALNIAVEILNKDLVDIDRSLWIEKNPRNVSGLLSSAIVHLNQGGTYTGLSLTFDVQADEQVRVQVPKKGADEIELFSAQGAHANITSALIDLLTFAAH